MGPRCESRNLGSACMSPASCASENAPAVFIRKFGVSFGRVRCPFAGWRWIHAVDRIRRAGGWPKARPLAQTGGIRIPDSGASWRARAGVPRGAGTAARAQGRRRRALAKAGFSEPAGNRPTGASECAARPVRYAAAECDERILIGRSHVMFLVEEPRVGRSEARRERAGVYVSRHCGHGRTILKSPIRKLWAQGSVL